MFSLRKILLAVDFSITTEAAIAKTIILARRLRAEVIPLFVLGDAEMDAKIEDEMKHIHEHFSHKMEMLVARLNQEKIKVYHSFIHEGSPADAILGVAERIGVDLIVIGAVSQQTSLSSLGKTTECIIRLAASPVLVVHPEDSHTEINNVLCVVDSTAASDQTLDTAIFICRELIAELHVLHIFDQNSAYEAALSHSQNSANGNIDDKGNFIFEEINQIERSIYLIFKRKIRSSGLKYRMTARQGEVSQVISSIGLESNSELIVMGTVEKKEDTVFYSPDTIPNLMQQLPCSILLVKHFNFADEDCPTVVINAV